MPFDDQKCKRCRRAGQKLFLKGERCAGSKCAMVKRAYPPGLHGRQRSRRLSEYGQQLAEKQKVRYAYGLSEKQFKNYFKKVLQQKGDKAELFLQQLECRLDNVVFRLGWASSRSQARQMVSHGHILVNNQTVKVPSAQVKKGQVIAIREKSRKLDLFKDLKITLKKYQPPTWLSLDKNKLEAKVVGRPQLKEMESVGDLSMVLEYYSR